MKIVTIIGARPQFIKAAALSREIAKHQDIDEVIIHTGQHYDKNMSDIFFEEMQIPKPDYNLGINGKTHGAMTGEMLERIEKVLLTEKPDFVLVFGDTNTTLSGALAAAKLHIKIIHIEAGIRSFNMSMAEEVNRILTDRISFLLYCPTDAAMNNLFNEGFSLEPKMQSLGFGTVVKVGDITQDAAMYYSTLAKKPQSLPCDLSKPFLLSTIHRAENTDDPDRLKGIVDALNELSNDIQIVLPLHPRTKHILDQNNLTFAFETVPPIGYLEMLYLLKECKIIVTDSGGMQKEAFFFEKPCITLRDDTEWPELLDYKFNVLAGANKEKILDLYHHFDYNRDYDIDFYGQGKAASRIISHLKTYAS